MNRGLLMSTVDLMVLLAAVLALYGIYKYHKAEQSDYRQLVERMKDLAGDLESLKRFAEAEIKAHDVDLTTHSSQIKDLQKQIDQMQEHIAKLRGSYMKIRDRVLTQKKTIKIQGAIPVEVMGPSKESIYDPESRKRIIEKVKKQLKEVEK